MHAASVRKKTTQQQFPLLNVSVLQSKLLVNLQCAWAVRVTVLGQCVYVSIIALSRTSDNYASS